MHGAATRTIASNLAQQTPQIICTRHLPRRKRTLQADNCLRFVRRPDVKEVKSDQYQMRKKAIQLIV
ncbi:hypothetical protein D3C76_1779200 [compost metagenome]